VQLQAGRIAPASTSDLPSFITCTTQYRPDATSSEGRVTDRVKIERIDGLGCPRHPTLSYPAMNLSVSFIGDAPDGRVVNVVVVGADGATVASALYHYGSAGGLRHNFGGGHGFTGLHYVYHGGAMLQFWCQAD
jgi:hypothetical protein